MATTGTRSVTLSRLEHARFTVTNERGGSITLGEGDTAEFTPVELLLAAVAGCSAIDVDYLTARRAQPVSFEVDVSGEKIKDDSGNRLSGVEVTFRVVFPEGPDGDRARDMLPRAIQTSHDRLCTVSRTVELPTPVTTRAAD
ncbi:MAG: OsmC family protein [Micropruina sp.]|nr:OsmC family protein [Micropruina sp.]